MRILLCVWISVFILSTPHTKSYSQDYLKVFEDNINYAETKIKRLTNGDLILATSSLESLRNGGKDASLFCQRLDYCGQLIWSRTYKIPDDHIILNDLSLLNKDEIVLFGSVYEGLKESIFLFKINLHTGISEELKVFNPGTVDHFTYSMDIHEDNIFIYGLLLDFNTKKNGFIAQFNSKLNFIWANKFLPFESSGRCLLTSEKTIISYSGNYLFKFNSKGLPQWAFELKGDRTLKIISGPILSEDGAIFEAVADSAHFLFKINYKGEKIWESDRFKGLGRSSAISYLKDGNLHISILRNNLKQKSIGQIMFSKSGQLTTSSHFILPQKLNSTYLNQHLDSFSTNTIIGSMEPFVGKPGEINSFLLQYSLQNNTLECLQMETENLYKSSFTEISLEPFTPIYSAFNMTQEKSFRPDTSNWDRKYKSFCQFESKDLPQLIDTLLDCNESWKITLPGNEYIWWDNYSEKERNLSIPGLYKAYKLSCTNPAILHFNLKKKNCNCPIFIPNAFSPNNDGINDILEIYSSCEIISYEWKIFSRWGNLIDQGLDAGWTGYKSGLPLNQDTYVVVVNYKVRDVDGILKEGQQVQNINLIR